MIVVDRESAELLHREPEPEKSFAVLDRRATAQDLQGTTGSASKGRVRSKLASVGSGIWSVLSHEMVLQPLIMVAVISGVLGGVFWVSSNVGAQQREIASEGSASIMASATGASIDTHTKGLPGSTRISGSFGDESVQIPLKDPATGKTLKTVEALGAEDYSYTIKGTLDDYSISFKENGSGADGKSYRYDSKTEKIRTITEKDLW